MVSEKIWRYRVYNEGCRLENVNSFKDLGVTFDNHLIFDKHVTEKINKAYRYSVLGVIKWNFKNVSVEHFLHLYETIVRPHLEYANQVWFPHDMSGLDRIEKMQKRATKIVIHRKSKMSYEQHLRLLKLPTIHYWRTRGDMIEMYKSVTRKMIRTVKAFILC